MTMWQNIGCKPTPGASVQEVMKQAGLDWNLVQRQHAWFTDTLVHPINEWGWYRSDNDAHFVTAKTTSWHPVQNETIVNYFVRWSDIAGVEIERIGAIDGGQTVICLAKLNQKLEQRSGDHIDAYALLSTPHEYGRATTIRLVLHRGVCTNTLVEKRFEVYRQSHRKAFDPEGADRVIASFHENLAQLKREYETLQEIKLSVDDAMKKVIVPIRTGKTFDEWKDSLKESGRLDFPRWFRDIEASIKRAPGATPGNAYGVLQGVTHYTSHYGSNEAGARLSRVAFGAHRDFVAEVQQKLLEMV